MLCAALALTAAGIARAEGFNVIETRQAGQDLLSAITPASAPWSPQRAISRRWRIRRRRWRVGCGNIPRCSRRAAIRATTPRHCQRSGAIWPASRRRRTTWLTRPTRWRSSPKRATRTAYAAQIKVLGDTCTACHRTFRERYPPPEGYRARTSRPGCAPVYSPCSNTGVPATRVAT